MAWPHLVRSALLRSQQAATLKGKHHDSAALHHRARDLWAEAGKEGENRQPPVLFDGKHFFPFCLPHGNPGKSLLSVRQAEPPASPLHLPDTK